MSDISQEFIKKEWYASCPTEQSLDDFLTTVFGPATLTITSNNRRCRILDETCNAVICVSSGWYINVGTYDANQNFYDMYNIYRPTTIGITKFQAGSLTIYNINGTYNVVIGSVVDGQNAVFTNDGFVIKNVKSTFTPYDIGADLSKTYLFPGIYNSIPSKKTYTCFRMSSSTGCFVKANNTLGFLMGKTVIFP